MRMNLKAILAAIGIAVLASPVIGYGSDAWAQAGGRTPGGSADNAHGAVSDCVHTAFPQCSDWRRTKRIHKKVHATHKYHKYHKSHEAHQHSL
jgi:hypothetical protein